MSGSLFAATASNSAACAKAVIHVKDCPVCPSDWCAFLPPIPGRLRAASVFCEEGERIVRMIDASYRDIAEAVKHPMKRELAS